MTGSPKNENKKLYGQVNLPYFKQGDDFNACQTNDIHESLNNHIALLKSAIEHLEKLRDLIPQNPNIEMYGDTHYIGISGEESILKPLLENELITVYENESEEENSEVFDEGSDDESSEED